MTRRLIKNALANLARGSAAAIIALLLPPVLVRHMSPASYAVWVLALQAAAYLAYLDFGLQTAVGRYIAFANEKRDVALRDGVFSAALAGLVITSALGLLLIVIFSLLSQEIFPSVPPDLLTPFRITMLIVGAGTAVALPGSAWCGIFVGLQRYEIPALANSTGKLLLAIGLIWAAITGGSLVLMAIIMAGTNLYTFAMQFFAQRRVAPQIHFRRSLIAGPIIKELFGYCLSLSVWSFSMLLINGFDLILVGRFQFSAVTPYSVAATLITFLAGIQIAIFGVIMPHAAELHAREKSGQLGQLLIKSTRFGVLLLLVTGLPLVTFASPIVGMWIGPQFASTGGKVLAILVAANMIRLTGTPYASILLGTGQQKQIIVGPLAEGFTNLLASVVLGLSFGAIGVAWGTLLGAIVGISANILYNLSRTQSSIRVSRAEYSGSSLLLPALCGTPIYLALLARSFNARFNIISTPALLTSLCCCAGFFLLTRSQIRTLTGSRVEAVSEEK